MLESLICKELVHKIRYTNFEQKQNNISTQITLHLTKNDNEVHTDTNSVELMIRVEAFNAF